MDHTIYHFLKISATGIAHEISRKRNLLITERVKNLKNRAHKLLINLVSFKLLQRKNAKIRG